MLATLSVALGSQPAMKIVNSSAQGCTYVRNDQGGRWQEDRFGEAEPVGGAAAEEATLSSITQLRPNGTTGLPLHAAKQAGESTHMPTTPGRP